MSLSSPSSSDKSTDSYASVLSDDSYIAKLKPGIDDEFQRTLSHIRMIETNRKILKERKIQSHEVKKRDLSDTKTEAWTAEMESDYLAYKAKANVLAATKKVHAESAKAVDQSIYKDISTQESARKRALSDQEKWLEAAIIAAQARLSFMYRYPDALSTVSTKTHITAAEDTLNSAKAAQRAIVTQRKSKIKSPTP